MLGEIVWCPTNAFPTFGALVRDALQQILRRGRRPKLTCTAWRAALWPKNDCALWCGHFQSRVATDVLLNRHLTIEEGRPRMTRSKQV
eukprot:scaffold94054_cov23-Tisochrysis_lutea.AAC.1